MKRYAGILLSFVILCCLVQACAAISASGVTTSPSQVNALKPGDEISEVAGTITLPTSGTMTFNPDDSVEFYTQLDNAKWSIAIVIGGNANPARSFGGKHATIGGYDLSYPTTNYPSVTLQFSMTASTVPTTFPSGTVTLVQVQEVDPSDNPVGSAVFVNGTVINPQALQTQLDTVKGKLADLKESISAKSAQGIDVTTAQTDYNQASSALDSAAVEIISSPSDVTNLLSTATSAITDGSNALDQADADHSIQQAKAMLASVDGLINEFTVNDSLKTSDPRLSVIINKRDLAAQTITNANDLFTTSQFTSAKTKAADGLGLANQAWNLSLDLKTELGTGGFTLPGLPNLSGLLPYIIIFLVILGIGGFLIYRKKNRWDELG
ncbi:MAG TPA: hypothetical protein VEI51_04405 [Methanomicrobiales archaeon]|nr:hypothetical protein [Methanomicrobiales archaeon]